MRISLDSNYESKFLIHDIEIFKNFFSDVFLIPLKNKLIITMLWDSPIPDYVFTQIKERLPKYQITFITLGQTIEVLDKLQPILIGYNSFNFDDKLITIVANSIHNFSNDAKFLDYLHKEAQLLIKGEPDFRFKKRYLGIDLMRVSGLDRIYKPLKQTASNLRHSLIKDLPIAYDARVELSDIVDLVVYEVNDCEIPEKMLYGIPKEHNSPLIPKTAYKGLLPAIKFRIEMSEYFNLDLVNSNKSQIGEKLASKLYAETSGRDPREFKKLQTQRSKIKYSDVIFDVVSFKTKKLQKFLENLKTMVYKPYGDKDHKATFKFNIIQDGLEIVFAQGGLHGVSVLSKIFKRRPGIKLIDLDVGSFYPSLYWKYFIEPAHLKGFTNFVGKLIELRLKYKAEGNKLFANGLKIAINRIYGGFSDDFGWLKDDQALLKTTINGQLMLMMLIERLYLAGIQTYYANTDGITVVCPDEKEVLLEKIWREWEQELDLILERDDFKESYIRDVNNFINIKTNGSIKLKGAYEFASFIEKYGELDLSGSYSMPIVSYAVVKYFTEHIPVEKTITNHVIEYPFDGIYDYAIAKKSSKQFKNVLLSVTNDKKVKIEVLQQSVRYFISKSNNKIFKVKEKTDKDLVKLVKDFRLGKKAFLNSYYLSNTLVDKPDHILLREFSGRYIYVIEGAVSKKMWRKEWLSYTDVMVGRTVTLLNDKIPESEYKKIDFNFYIDEAYKLINAIEKYAPSKK